MLKQIHFSDLYVRLDMQATARFRPVAADSHLPGNMAIPDTCADDIEAIRQLLIQESRSETALTYSGMRLRASIRRMADGSQWASLRRIPGKIPALEKLGIEPHLMPVIKALGGRKSGLVVLCGATGEGKTTTAIAMLNDYLKRYGSLAYTVEDPVEYQMQGEVGEKGYCFQIEVYDDEQWFDELKAAMRWHPRYILVGEIRTPEAAKQLLRAATSGHLVITTVHAGSVEEGLSSLFQMAEPELGSMTPHVVADALSAIMYQQLTRKGAQIDALVTDPENPGDPIRQYIREGKLAGLRTLIQQQEAKRRVGA